MLILVPTRELALQTSQVCKELGKHMNVQVMVSTGGTSLKDDIMRLYSTVHILVATPGRVLDLANKGVADLSKCEMMVMDEVSFFLCKIEGIVLKLILCASRPTNYYHQSSNLSSKKLLLISPSLDRFFYFPPPSL